MEDCLLFAILAGHQLLHTMKMLKLNRMYKTTPDGILFKDLDAGSHGEQFPKLPAAQQGLTSTKCPVIYRPRVSVSNHTLPLRDGLSLPRTLVKGHEGPMFPQD